jgi:hypothetical protein
MEIIDKVNVLDLSSLRLGEQIEFYGLVNDIITKYDPKTLEVVNASEPFAKSFQETETRFKKSYKSPITSAMSEKDKLRDEDIICMRIVADGMTHHFDPEVKNAAYLILSTIDRFGTRIYSMNYEEETVVLRNLINELKTSLPLIDAIKKLNMKNLLANLEKNNNEFRELYKSRVEEKFKNDDGSATELMKEVSECYKVLVRTLESRAFLMPSEPLSKVIGQINIMIQRQMDKIRYRESRRGQDPVEQNGTSEE